MQILRTKAPPPFNEPPSVIGRRKIVVAVFLLIGAALLGYSLSRSPPGDETFLWLTFALAGVWALGGVPLRSGALRARALPGGTQPASGHHGGSLVGLALGGAFVVGGLVAREIPGGCANTSRGYWNSPTPVRWH